MTIGVFKGDVISRNGQDWLVLDKSVSSLLLILLQKNKFKRMLISADKLNDELQTGKSELRINDEQFSPLAVSAETPAARRINERQYAIANELISKEECLFWIADRNAFKKFVTEMSKKYDVGELTVRRFLLRYMQNNLSLSGLECKYMKCGGRGKMKSFGTESKRSGRRGLSFVVRTEEIVSIFETMLKRYIASKGSLSFHQLYVKMLLEFFSREYLEFGQKKVETLPTYKCPSERQLQYYISTHLTKGEQYEISHGKKMSKNNIRPLLSDTISNLPIKSIGARYEMDATETDFYLVSSMDASQVIGRAIVYFIVDVYSRAIVGFTVGVDNNAWAGAEMALLNMVENKVELCNAAGISIVENEWPMYGMLPMEIQVDNGPEFISDKFVKFGTENGIMITNVESQMGSMKPVVEQKFRQFNLQTKGILPGEIKKDAYGRPHLRSARMNIEDFQKVVLQFIVHYNNSPMLDYPADTSIIREGIVPTPANIWTLKMSSPNGLRKVRNMNDFKFSLLLEGKAKITREGIEFNKVKYLCEDDVWLQRNMMDVPFSGKGKKYDVRYDCRNMNYLYIEDKGRYIKCWINDRKISNEKYMNCSELELQVINQKLAEKQKEYRELKTRGEVQLHAKFKEIAKTATRRHKVKNNVKDITNKRRIEKKLLHQQSQVVLETGVTKMEIPETSKAIESPVQAPVLTNVDVSNMSPAELIKLTMQSKFAAYAKSFEGGE